MHRLIVLIAVFVFATIASHSVMAEVVTLTPGKDNTLYEDEGGTLSNGAGTGLFMGKTAAREEFKLRRAVLAFDLTGIPDGAVVESVSLAFWINKAPPGANSGNAKLHRLKKDWGEGDSLPLGPGGDGTDASVGDATWTNRFFDTIDWDLPGGDFMSVPSATTGFGSSSYEGMTFDSTPELVADVQSWLTDPSMNFGWILIGDENSEQNARRLASREEIVDPKPELTITYSIPSVVDNLALNLLTDELVDPISMAHAGDGSGRLFIVEQSGVIRIFDQKTNTLLATPFLDISSEVYSGGNEQGLLSVAFHPNYSSNGRFYVNYIISPTPGEWHTVVAEFEVTDNPDIAEPVGSVIMQFEQDDTNHNGGDMHFGPDGYLYIASGDGGGREDQYENGQDLGTLLGAMLRIDVDGTPDPGAETCGLVADYGIPAGNPFTGAGDGCDEILHFGLRNPWRFSFDAATSDLWIADVGQYAWEEANQTPPGEVGLNYGWSCREGEHDFNLGTDCISPYTDPVIEYPHSQGNCSITGGYVFRGSNLPIQGRYVYGDFCTATVWVATFIDGEWVSEEWPLTTATLQSLASFGQDESCNLFLIDRDAETGNQEDFGTLYRIEDSEMLFNSGFELRNCL